MRRAILASAVVMTACLVGACGQGSTDGSDRHEDEPPLRRLTESELSASVDFLLGVRLEWPVEQDLRELGSTRVGATHSVLSERGVADYSIALGRAADRVAADPDRLRAVLRCESLDDWTPCARQAILGFGGSAWRRPLEPSEVARYEQLAERIAAETQDPVRRGRTLLYALLASPNFLYRHESVGGGGHATTVLSDQYDGVAMAARLSFFIWNAPPEEALLRAALRGELDTAEGVAAHAYTMLNDPRAADGLDAFVADLFAVHAIASIEREPLNLIDNDLAFYISENADLSSFLTDVRESEVEEMQRIFRHVALDSDADMMEVFSTRTTFVNETLMRFYDGEVRLSVDYPLRPDPPPEPTLEQRCSASIEYICDGRDPCERFAARYCEGHTDTDCRDDVFDDLCRDQDRCLDFFAETCPGAEHCAWLPEFGCVDPDDTEIRETVGYDPYVPFGIEGWVMAERRLWAAPRLGVLGTLGFLSLHGGFDTSPTRRGRFVVESLLCRSIGTPPAAAAGARLPMNGDSRRRQHEAMVGDPLCHSCHEAMDGIGFALDVFGPAGIPREQDRFGHPFDLTGQIDGQAFDGPVELAETIARHPDARACMARQLFRFATGSGADAVDEALADRLAVHFERANGRYRQFVIDLVSSPEFRFRFDDTSTSPGTADHGGSE